MSDKKVMEPNGDLCRRNVSFSPRLEAAQSHLTPVEAGCLGAGPSRSCFSPHLPSLQTPIQSAQLQGQGGTGSLFLASPAEGSRAELRRVLLGLEISASLPEGKCKKHWASALLPGVHMHGCLYLCSKCTSVPVFVCPLGCVCWCVHRCACVEYGCLQGTCMAAVYMLGGICAYVFARFLCARNGTASGSVCIWGTRGYLDDLCIGVCAWLVRREEKRKVTGVCCGISTFLRDRNVGPCTIPCPHTLTQPGRLLPSLSTAPESIC